MKRLKLKVLSLTLSIMTAISVTSTVQAEVTTLRMASWLPPAHHMQKTLSLWTSEVEKATDGQVKIQLMSASLAPPPGQYDLVKNGIVDIAYGIAAFTPKRFNQLRAIEVPFMFESAEAASAGLFDWYTKNGFDKKEFSGTKILASFTHAPFLVHSREPLVSLDDFKGLKIRAGGNGIEIFKKLGAAPVFLAPGETTEALQRGTVDATQFTWESLSGFRLMDLAEHHLVIPGGLYGTAFWIAMNEKSWKKLTPSQRESIEGMGLSGSQLIGKRWDEVEQVSRAKAIEAGNTVVTLEDAEVIKLKQSTAFVENDWVAKMDKSGKDGAALLKQLSNTIKSFQ